MSFHLGQNTWGKEHIHPPCLLFGPWGCLCIQSLLWVIARWARLQGVMAIFKTLERSTAWRDTLQLPHQGIRSLLSCFLLTVYELKGQCLVQRQVSENTGVPSSDRKIFSSVHFSCGKHFIPWMMFMIMTMIAEGHDDHYRELPT